MAIFNANQTNLAAQNTLPTSSESSKSVTPQGDVGSPKPNELQQGLQTVEQVTTGFSSILALLQQGSEMTEKRADASVKDSADPLSMMQTTLFSGLGIQAGEGQSLEQKIESLTSDASIQKFQTAFLFSLQQSMFSAEQAASSSNANSEAGESGKEQANPLFSRGNVQTQDDNTQGKEIGKLEAMSFGSNGLEASDGFDVVNILNHLPVVSEVYKNVSGHDVSAVSKLAGGFLYGGTTGLAFSALDLTTKSLFDNSISGLIANFDYSSLLPDSVDQTTAQAVQGAGKQLLDAQLQQLLPNQKPQSQSATPQPTIPLPTTTPNGDAVIHWENSQVGRNR